MTDSERRYGPTIDLQGFDLRTNMDTIEEPSRLPLLVVMALVVLATFAGVVWLAYTQGVERGRASVSRELMAQELWKVRRPDGPAYTGLKIYEPPAAADQSAKVNVAVPARRTAANAIPALRPTAGVTVDNSAPASAGAPAKPFASAAPQNSGKASVPAATPQTQRIATRAPTELAKPAAPPSMPAHPITAPDSLPPTSPTAFAAGSVSAPAAVSTPIAASRPPAPAALSGVVLQIGSYKSEAEARRSWIAFKSGHDAAAGYQPDVTQVDLGAKGTWYRLRMGPFADKKTALETCAKLKADGASCLLAQ